jgi:fatty-acyl-CoA synthase/long-chain acyl-CoA synthetase
VPAEVDFLGPLAESHPGKTAIIEGERRLTFAELDALANRYGHVLSDLKVGPGDKVIWVGQNGLEVVALTHACRKVGAVSVPMNYRLTSEEAAYVIDNSDAVAVLFDPGQTAQLEGTQDRCPQVRRWLAFRCGDQKLPDWAGSIDGLAAEAPSDAPAVLGDDPSAGSTMIYTSGTTGKPKGTVRRAPDPAVGAALVALIGWVPDDVYLTTGPLYHSGPLGFMGVVQRLGGTVVVQRHFDPRDWLDLVQRHRITTTFSAPTPIRRVLDLGQEVISTYDTSSLARVIANAAPWPFELKRRYVEALGPDSLWEVYGSTELGVDTVLAPEDQMRKPGSCGRPAPLVDLRLYDDEGNLVDEPHQPGELFVRSGGAFSTYYKDDEKYERGRRGEYLSVGDVAYRDEEGFYYICDRKSDMVISGGMNIYPAEIEAVLVAHPAVADAAVFGIPSEEWGESVHAVITERPGQKVSDEELTEFARGHLAGYKLPRSFSRMEEIPRTPSGKILKRELRAPYWQDRG